MSRLIDADELKKMFPDKGEGAWTYNTTAQGYINAMPTVDLWHYPSKGEYPPKEQEYFVAFKPREGDIYYDVYTLYPELKELCTALAPGEQVYAWQYIVPPRRGV